MPLTKLLKFLHFNGFHYFGGVNEKNVNYYSSNLGGGSLIAMSTYYQRIVKKVCR